MCWIEDKYTVQHITNALDDECGVGPGVKSTPAAFLTRWRVNSSFFGCEHLQVDFLSFSISMPAPRAACLLCWWLEKAEWTDISVCVFGCSLAHVWSSASFWGSVCSCQPNSNNSTMQTVFTIIKGTVKTKKRNKMLDNYKSP